jgi:hypothetical protein
LATRVIEVVVADSVELDVVVVLTVTVLAVVELTVSVVESTHMLKPGGHSNEPGLTNGTQMPEFSHCPSVPDWHSLHLNTLSAGVFVVVVAVTVNSFPRQGKAPTGHMRRSVGLA